MLLCFYPIEIVIISVKIWYKFALLAKPPISNVVKVGRDAMLGDVPGLRKALLRHIVRLSDWSQNKIMISSISKKIHDYQREKLLDFFASNNFHDCQRKVALPFLPDRSEPGRHGEQGEGDHCGDYLPLHNFNHLGCHLLRCIWQLQILIRYHFNCHPRSPLPLLCTKRCIH